MMRVEFIRESIRERTTADVDSSVCIVSLMPGDPQAELPASLRSSLVRSFRTPVSKASRRRALERSLPPPTGDLRVDTLLIRSPLTLPHLPGLDDDAPSRVRDCATLLLDGLSAVWVVIVTGLEEPNPSDPDVLTQLRIALDALPGKMVVFPDLDRPSALPMPLVGVNAGQYQAQLQARFSLWESKVLGIGSLLREQFLTGLADLPHPQLAELLDVGGLRQDHAELPDRLLACESLWVGCVQDSLARLSGLDLSLCTWSGPWHALSRHGWRSSAALVARVLGAFSGSAAMAQLERRKVAISGGRRGPHACLSALLPDLSEGFAPDGDVATAVIVARLLPEGDACVFEGQANLRQPVGFWTLPAVRALKDIELTLRRVAERYTFQPVTQTSALELMNSLQYGLDEHLIAGVLSPLDNGEPLISTRPDRGATPGLIAHVVGTLRPWSHVLRFRVSVRTDGVSLEVS